MKDFSEFSLFELAEMMQALQSGKLALTSEDRERLLEEIESRVQRRKQNRHKDPAERKRVVLPWHDLSNGKDMPSTR